MDKRTKLAELLLDRAGEPVTSLKGIVTPEEAEIVINLALDVLLKTRDVYYGPSSHVVSEETDNA